MKIQYVSRLKSWIAAYDTMFQSFKAFTAIGTETLKLCNIYFGISCFNCSMTFFLSLNGTAERLTGG